MQKKISVQICTYNRKESLSKVLLSLFDQTLSPDAYEVVLVDDGSTDGTEDLVKELDPPYHLQYIRQNNSGLATARNKGIREAEGEYILFIDDDVLADRRLLEEHLLAHLRYPHSVINGWVNHVVRMERPQSPRFTLQDISTAFFWTSNVSVKKEYLLQVGLFDESFKEYGWEDLEIGHRLRKLGLKSRTNKRARAYHYKKKISNKDLPRLVRQAEAKGRTAVLFVKKHPVFRVKLATGVYWARLILDRLMFSGDYLLNFCQRRIDASNGRILEGIDLWCAHQLIKFYYFQAVRKSLKDKD